MFWGRSCGLEVELVPCLKKLSRISLGSCLGREKLKALRESRMQKSQPEPGNVVTVRACTVQSPARMVAAFGSKHLVELRVL